MCATDNYHPTHRRATLSDPVEFIAADPHNDARCAHFGERHCTGTCPRHHPVDYAEMMARHATDSVR